VQKFRYIGQEHHPNKGDKHQGAGASTPYKQIKTMEQMHHGKNKGEDFYSLFFRNLGGREDKFIVAVISSANFYHFSYWNWPT